MRARLVVRPKFPHQHTGIVGGLLNYTCRGGRGALGDLFLLWHGRSLHRRLGGRREGAVGVGGHGPPQWSTGFLPSPSRRAERVPGPEAPAALLAVEGRLWDGRAPQNTAGSGAGQILR